MMDLSDYGIEAVKNASCIYRNPLNGPEDIKNFVLEGKAVFSFPDGRLRMENQLDAANGQKANYVLWCPEEFPADLFVRWQFYPVREPGLCMGFLAAKGRNGEDLFSPSLAPRTGEYVQYHHGDIDAFHISYFRRKEPDERAFHTCNLRKSYGFYLTAQGGDPIPDADEAAGPYEIAVLKRGNEVRFYINALELFRFEDDGETYGKLLEGGKIGFRQLAPMIGEYENLEVWTVTKKLKKKTKTS